MRFVMMERTGESPERCLAWILHRKMQNYAKDWIAQSQSIEVLEPSQSDLRDLLTDEFSAIAQNEHTQLPWVVPFSIDEITKADEIYEVRGVNPYEYGPTYMNCWWREDRFFYLERHLES